MITETATKAKMHFGRILEKSQREPVLIEKSGHEYSVVISFEDYKRLKTLEDAYWAKLADEAKGDGFVGQNKSQSLLENLVHAKD